MTAIKIRQHSSTEHEISVRNSTVIYFFLEQGSDGMLRRMTQREYLQCLSLSCLLSFFVCFMVLLRCDAVYDEISFGWWELNDGLATNCRFMFKDYIFYNLFFQLTFIYHVIFTKRSVKPHLNWCVNLQMRRE